MLKNVLFLIFILFGLIVSGCTVEQKQPMGANENVDEGFSGFGTMRARELEGPLSDMMVPDERVKGRSKVADEIADGEPYISREANLGLRTKKDGANIYSGKVGLIDDQNIAGDRPDLQRKQDIVEGKGKTIEEKITLRLKNLETINNVYVVSDDGFLLVGVESSEQDRTKLLSEVNKEIKKVTTKENVKVALDNKNIKRIKKLQQKKKQQQ